MSSCPRKLGGRSQPVIATTCFAPWPHLIPRWRDFKWVPAVLAKALALDHKLGESHALFGDVYSVWQKLKEDDRFGPAHALVVGAATLIKESVRAAKRDVARHRYQELKRLVDVAVENRWLPPYQSRTALILAKASLDEGDVREARELYDDLRVLAERQSRSRSLATPEGPTPESEEPPVQEANKPVIQVERSESGTSITAEWAPSPQGRMGKALAGILASMFQPLLGFKAYKTLDGPDCGPTLRQAMFMRTSKAASSSSGSSPPTLCAAPSSLAATAPRRANSGTLGYSLRRSPVVRSTTSSRRRTCC